MAARKVLIVIGSPRRDGNSATLAGELASGARSAGAVVEEVFLHELEIRPCSACEACQELDTSGSAGPDAAGTRAAECVIGDDMDELYPRLREMDALVVATPVYWFTVTAQTKLFLDRIYPLVDVTEEIIGPDGSSLPVVSEVAGKELGIILTYGDRDAFRSGAVNALRTLQDGAHYVGLELVGMVYGSASEPGEIVRRADLMSEAYALGRRLGEGPAGAV